MTNFIGPSILAGALAALMSSTAVTAQPSFVVGEPSVLLVPVQAPYARPDERRENRGRREGRNSDDRDDRVDRLDRNDDDDDDDDDNDRDDDDDDDDRRRGDDARIIR